MKHHPIKSIVAGVVLGVLFCSVPSAWAEPETYRVDPVHSSLVFRIGHLGISHFYGVFRDLEGTLTITAWLPSKKTTDTAELRERANRYPQTVCRPVHEIKGAGDQNAIISSIARPRVEEPKVIAIFMRHT